MSLATGTTDQEGKLTWIPDIKWTAGETYSLQETNPPEGYQLLQTLITFTVTEDGEVQLSDNNNGMVSIEESDGSYVITIKNEISLSTIKITKISAESNELKLEGATFKLQKWDETANTYVDVVGADGEIIICTTGENGEALFENLQYGKYQLIEIEAPTGYVLSGEPITVEINAQNNGVIEVSVENEILYELPSAGGSGIYRYTIGGTLLMLAGALVLYKNRRREVLGKN